MQGIHIIANFYECQYDFNQEKSLLEHCINTCIHHGLNVVGSTYHNFVPQGITFSILLAESHLCLHTWPEHESVCFDIYICNHNSINEHIVEKIFNEIKKILQPKKFIYQTLDRTTLLPKDDLK